MPNIATVKKTKKAKTKKETTNADLPEKSSNSFLDKTKEVASNVGGHLKRNWKRYALGAAVAGAAYHGNNKLFGGSNANANASANTSEPTKKPVVIKDVPLVAPTSTPTSTPKPTVVAKPKKIKPMPNMDGWVAKNKL